MPNVIIFPTSSSTPTAGTVLRSTYSATGGRLVYRAGGIRVSTPAMHDRLEVRLSPESELYAELVQFERGLHDLLTGFANRLPLSRSAELRTLAEEISQQQLTGDVDIHQWARRLAEDVARLTD